MFVSRIFGGIRHRAGRWLPCPVSIFGVCRSGAWVLESWTGEERGVGQNDILIYGSLNEGA